MKIITYCMAMLMAVLLISCNKNKDSASVENIQMQDLQVDKTEEENVHTAIGSITGQTSSKDTGTLNLQAGQPIQKIDWDKKIIKTANLTLELKNYSAFNSALHINLKRYGAYIASEQQNETGYKIENIITIKVPVTEFDNLIDALPTAESKILEKRITSEDVTGEVVDTKGRIEAKKQIRDRYYDLLKQAKNMKEILEVQTEINALQESIEAGSGRVQFLSQQAAYSTINLTYFQVINPAVQPDTTPNFFMKFLQAFNNGTSIITGFILLVVTFWPVFLAGAIGWFIVKKSYWKRMVRKV